MRDRLKASRSIQGVWKYLLPSLALVLVGLPALAAGGWTNTGTTSSYQDIGSSGHLSYTETVTSDYTGTIYNLQFSVKSNSGSPDHDTSIQVFAAGCGGSAISTTSIDRTQVTTTETWISGFSPLSPPLSVTYGTSYCVKYIWDSTADTHYMRFGATGDGYIKKQIDSSAIPSPTISASNTPATTGGIAWSGHFVIFGAGESYRDSPRFLIYTGGTAIQTLGYGTYDTTSTDYTYFASGAEESNYAWPAGTYQVVVEQPTNIRTYSATATVTVVSHTNPSSAGTSILGFVDANGNIITPSAPGLKVATFSSYSACLELSLSGFSCLLNTSLANLAGLPIINIITSLPQNWAYAVNAPTSTLQLQIGVPSFQGGAATEWLIYDSTSSTAGIMGVSSSFVSSMRTSAIHVIDILMIFGLLLVAVDFFKGFI